MRASRLSQANAKPPSTTGRGPWNGAETIQQDAPRPLPDRCLCLKQTNSSFETKKCDFAQGMTEQKVLETI